MQHDPGVRPNASGNRAASTSFAPNDVTPFRGNTWQLQWQIIGPDSNVAYQTPCAVVTRETGVRRVTVVVSVAVFLAGMATIDHGLAVAPGVAATKRAYKKP